MTDISIAKQAKLLLDLDDNEYMTALEIVERDALPELNDLGKRKYVVRSGAYKVFHLTEEGRKAAQRLRDFATMVFEGNWEEKK